MDNNIKKSVEDLLLYKGKLIRNSKRYREYVRERLQENSVNDIVEAFVMGAIDGMIYDVGSALDFTKQKGTTDDVTAFSYRRRIIKKVWERKQ